MSTSLLYHGFGIRGYRYVKTEHDGGEVIFTIEQPRESYRCSACGSEHVIGRGQNHRRLRTVPIGGKPVYLMLPVPRVECRDCGAVRQVRIGFADARVSYTRAFQRYALELSRYMTIQDVARHLGISWDVIKEIQKADLKRRFDRPKVKHLRRIAIDEISSAKGHVYLTIVLDLESGAVVHVGRGKGGMPCGISGSGCVARGPRSRPWPPTCRRRTSMPSRPICPAPGWSLIVSM